MSISREQIRERLRSPHPYDVIHGLDTSGYVLTSDMDVDPVSAAQMVNYCATHPSIIRQALDTLSPIDLGQYHFVDIGCGKGRVLCVAMEYNFSGITGIEISATFAEIAKVNARQITQRMAANTNIEIVNGDATQFLNIKGNVVFFLYNPFGREMMAQFLDKIKIGLARDDLQHALIIYHNPVQWDLLDNNASFTRWFAGRFYCAEEEKNFGYPGEGATVIWQSTQNAMLSPHVRPEAKLVHESPTCAMLAPA